MFMTNFKVGDMVRVINGFGQVEDGTITEVAHVDMTFNALYLKVPNNWGGTMRLNAKYVEKVAEQVTKFKVGDKIRITGHGYGRLPIGTTAEVIMVDNDGDVWLNNGTFYLARNIELISELPTQNQRISTLEKEVEALKSEVAALKLIGTIAEKARSTSAFIREGFAQTIDGDKVIRRKDITTNEKRKAIISEAKAFVNESLNRDYFKNSTPKITSTSKTVFFTNDSFGGKTDEVGFIVNTKKRTVVAIIRTIREKYIVHKGIAKCALTDVFNVDIGKAIALGRALGLDVSKFEQAVQPTEYSVGQFIGILPNGQYAGNPYEIRKIKGNNLYDRDGDGWVTKECAYIIEDTEAKY